MIEKTYLKDFIEEDRLRNVIWPLVSSEKIPSLEEEARSWIGRDHYKEAMLTNDSMEDFQKDLAMEQFPELFGAM